MTRARKIGPLLAAASTLVASASLALAPEIIELPRPATAVSGDGRAVAGPGYDWGFHWTTLGGTLRLGHFESDAFASMEVNDLSHDGRYAVGQASYGEFSGGLELTAVWDTTAVVPLSQPSVFPFTRGSLGSSSGEVTESTMTGISDDGSFAVGYSTSPAPGAWEGFVDVGTGPLAGNAALLAPLFPVGTWADHQDVSADGQWIAGTLVGGGSTRPFRNQGAVYEEIFGAGTATAISADGSTVVGGSTLGFRWTESGGLDTLGDLPGGQTMSWAHGVSGDGEIVVGWGWDDDGQRAILWDPVSGIRNLEQVLAVDHGVDLSGWELTEATAISDDGLTIAGVGVNPQGWTRGWVVLLDSVASAPVAPGSDVDVDLAGVGVALALTTPDGGEAAARTLTRTEADALHDAAGLSLEASQTWEIAFDGTLAAPATVTLTYEDALFEETAESSLQVFHGDATPWTPLTVSARDPVANTVTFDTPGFSPFTVGIPLPEPSAPTLLSSGALLVWLLSRRRVARAHSGLDTREGRLGA